MSADLKVALKEAREAIKVKDFKTAAIKCQYILKKDDQNYMALVLMGAAKQDTNPAEAAKFLRKAIQIPNNNLAIALQGLSLCAEPTEMPDIGRQLLELVPDRFVDVHGKLLKAAIASINLAADVSPFVEIFHGDTKSDNEQRRNSAFQHLARLYITNAGCSANANWQPIFIEALAHSCAFPDGEQHNVLDVHVELFKAYLKLLYKVGSKCPDTLLREAAVMTRLFEKEVYPLEWICKVFVDRIDDNDFVTLSYLENPIEFYAERLLAMSPNSTLGLMTRAIHFCRVGQFVKARETLLKVNDLQRNWNVCLAWLAQTNYHLGAYPVAEILLRQLPDKNVQLLIECLVGQAELDGKLAKATEAVQLCAELLPTVSADQQSEVIYLLARALIASDQNEKAAKTISKLSAIGASNLSTFAHILHLLKTGENSAAVALLPAAQADPPRSQFFIIIGRTHLAQNHSADAIAAFMNAAKIDPYNSHCFYWLGQAFLNSQPSKDRAIKCLEKCLHLNSRHEAATTLLSVLYRESKNAEANETILSRATAHAVPGVVGPCPWVYPLLGAHYLSVGKYNEAVSAYRTALRECPDDIASWEKLADAYRQRGSLNSALKVFQKCLEMGSEQSQYARLQVANVKAVLGQHSEAVEEFEGLLSEDDGFVPALKGIAEAHMGLAKHNLERKLFGRSRHHLGQVVHFVTRAIQKRNDFAVLWRMMANALDAIASMSLEFATLVVSGQLANVPGVDEVTLRGDELYALAGRCYCRAVKLRPEDGLIWYELAANYYHRSIRYGNNEERKQWLERAVSVAKFTVQLMPGRWQNWNLLGVVCTTPEISNAALAQHALIKAVQLNRNAAPAWTNLGVLYRRAGDVILANRAFGRAQQAQTDYINGWTGQACIAEHLGQSAEAMDLFQHATTLQYTPESALGFVHWICMALSDPELARDPHVRYVCERMFGSTSALDSIEWYHRHEDTSTVETWCFAGYLYHRKGMWGNAVHAYRRAVEAGAKEPQLKDKMLFNLGVCLLRASEPLQAVQIFHEVTEATFESTVGLAVAHFRAGQVAEAYGVYESVLNLLASTDAQKSQVLVAMSAIVYTYQGEADAKSLLFQCIGLPDPPVEGLFSGCAVGIIHNDLQVSELVLKELVRHRNDPRYVHHIAFLTAQFHRNNNQPLKALNYLLSQVHIHPDHSELRKVLANFIMQNSRQAPQQLAAASRIAESTIVLQLRNLSCNNSSELGAKSLAMASEAMRCVDQHQRRQLAQRAVHVNPTCREAWAALLMCTQ